MTDERLAALNKALPPTTNPWEWPDRELIAALLAERGRVVRLEAALTDLIDGLRYDRTPLHLAGAYRRAVAVLAEGATTCTP